MGKGTLFSKSKLRVAGLISGATLLLATPIGIVSAQDNWRQSNDDDNRRSSVRDSEDNDERMRRFREWLREWSRRNENRLNDATCEERQTEVNEDIERYKQAAQERHEFLSNYLANQQAFVEQHNLDIENYDRLNEKAGEAQARLATEIGELEAPTVDCDRSEKHDEKLVKEATRDTRNAKVRFNIAVTKLSLAVIRNS